MQYSEVEPLTLSVSDFVALLNQTLEFAYPSVIIMGELTNFRVSKNRWVYFDLKDGLASVKFFGTVYQLPGPLEDGLMLQVRGMPRLHPQYGFSITIQSIQAVGEGSIKRMTALLEAKLMTEGLFDPGRKRLLPYPPVRIGLITSRESAAYADFIKVLGQRWSGMNIELADVQVQGEPAVGQIIAAIEYFNEHALPPEVLIITRGGGSAEDLAAFNTEQLTRAVAASRIPTLVAIGHEVDISLAERAADQRASTPSNAAELLVPDRRHVSEQLSASMIHLSDTFNAWLKFQEQNLQRSAIKIEERVKLKITKAKEHLQAQNQLLKALSPEAALQRGYALVRDKNKKLIKSVSQVIIGVKVRVGLSDGVLKATIIDIRKTKL